MNLKDFLQSIKHKKITRMNPSMTQSTVYTPKESFSEKYKPYLYQISKDAGYALDLVKYNKDNPI